MNDLEHALRELDVEWPATPDLAAAVMTRVAAGGEAARGADVAPGGEVPARAAWRRRLPAARSWRARAAYLLAALVVAGGGTLAASPGARSAVLEWLGLKSVTIERTEPRIGASVDLGPVIDLPKGTRVPTVLDDPEVHDTTMPDGTSVVSLVYDGPILVQVFRARVSPFIQKTVGMGATLQRVKDGYWITGSHGFAYESASGGTFEEQRLSDKVLLIERDGLLIRVEGNISKARALEIANSIR